MSNFLQGLLEAIEPDDWRNSVDFSADIKAANQEIFSTASLESWTSVLNLWLSKYQPCLFGKTAAKRGLISYCFITEDDLKSGDQFVQDKIQSARTKWTAAAHNGDKSAFIILLVSDKIARGLPGPTVKELAGRLSAHYLLLDQPEYDSILNDDIWLMMHGRQDAVWKWLCGVNYFCAQADGRWWQDHRIPGGMGFSINSVGHMVKSAQLRIASEEMEEAMGATSEDWAASNVKSLEEAFKHALQTIDGASNSISGKATMLKPMAEGEGKCPFTPPDKHKDKDPCTYEGFYHTDVTLPSEYFLPAVERPNSIGKHDLDFSYLFNDSLNNPSHITLAKGRRIRAASDLVDPNADSGEKALKAAGSVVKIDAEPRLKAALVG